MAIKKFKKPIIGEKHTNIEITKLNNDLKETRGSGIKVRTSSLENIEEGKYYFHIDKTKILQGVTDKYGIHNLMITFSLKGISVIASVQIDIIYTISSNPKSSYFKFISMFNPFNQEKKTEINQLPGKCGICRVTHNQNADGNASLQVLEILELAL